jgi:hypothetical protein
MAFMRLAVFDVLFSPGACQGIAALPLRLRFVSSSRHMSHTSTQVRTDCELHCSPFSLKPGRSTSTTLIRNDAQNISFIANWISRADPKSPPGNRVLVTCPKVLDVVFRFGLPKFG